ncbi:MAG: hypothetical protein JO237_10250 [Pseudolabrys sp.]|nr:hypothetical protein [Pseudolabrys sp.]
MVSPKIARGFDSVSHSREPTFLELAPQFIPAGADVLGVGGGALEARLPFGCSHRGISEENLLASDISGSFVVLIDALRAPAQAATLLDHVARSGCVALIGFRSSDELAFLDLIELLDRFRLGIDATADMGDDEMIVRVRPSKKLSAVAPCSVAVLSGGMTFAERLGRQMIDAILPGEADIHHINLGDLHAARDRYDLVILGTGQGLCRSLISDDVLDIVARGRAAIGIFGTQQRDLIPRDLIGRLIDELDVWFARNEEDVLLYGAGHDSVMHLGDWLVQQFPLGHARDEELLTIREDGLADLPLDRAIQAIQRHRAVFAHAPAALLCALASADTVAYADTETSGEFRSLLIDVFGRHFPEREFFQVDRDAVVRYRARVHRNAALLRKRLTALMGGRTAA